jgi:acyl-CoA ligase (AMP-forming) (exosortase A-associated)
VTSRIAVVDGRRRVSYAELLERCERWAGLLKRRGVRRGDRVAIFLPRSVEAVVALFAVLFAGGVAVIIYERLRTRQVNYILEHSLAAFLVTNDNQLLYVSDLQCPNTQIVNFDEDHACDAPFGGERAVGADPALLLYTSGSTGMPKGLILSHDNLLAGARIVADYLSLSEREVIISLLPFSFDYGLNQLLTSLLVGGRLVLQRSLFPPDICRMLVEERVSGMAAVPTLWLQLGQSHSPFFDTELPHLRYITNSGGPLPEHLVRRVRRVHPHVEVHLMYGLTEAFRSTHLPPEQIDARPTSIGKAIPNVEILVVGEDGRPCAPGEVGELVHRGANVALGYWRDPQASARVFRPHPFRAEQDGVRETVVFSGDLVRTDEEGYLYFVGRRDQLIKSRGFRVSPDEVERCLYASEVVSSVAAFGVPNGDGDTDIVAAVIPKDPSTFREEALRVYCNAELSEYLRPRVIWRLDELPLTASGKPDRCALKQAYVDGIDRTRAVAGAAGAA